MEQCAIFRGKMSTDKIFLGCKEHEINSQDLVGAQAGPPGGGRGGGAAVRGVGWGAAAEHWAQSTELLLQSTNLEEKRAAEHRWVPELEEEKT